MHETAGAQPAASPPGRFTGPAVRTALVALLLGPAPVHVGPAVAGNGVWTGGGPRAKSIEAVARDPLNPMRMWAASFGAGVYRSLDGGATWTGYRAGLTNTFVRSLAVNPAVPDSVYCGTNDGLFVSVDGGMTWTKLLSTTVSIRAIAVHPWRRATVYAASYGNGIYKSLNGGKTWSTINLGLVNTKVRSVALEPAHPDTLLAGTGTGGGIHRSLNGGLTWSQVPDTTATAGAVEEIVYDRANPPRVYAATLDRGVLKSPDDGVSWVRVNQGLTSFRGRAVAVVDSFRFFGTDSAGIFGTTLPDSSWHPTGAGIPSGVAVDGLLPAGPGSPTVWAGADGPGLFRTDTRGGSWSQMDGGLLGTFGFALAVRPSTHALYVGTGFGDQFWKSTDQGGSWTRTASLSTHDSERAVVPDPVDPAVVFMTAYGAGVFRSDDDGAHWRNTDSLLTTLRNPFVRPLVAWPAQRGHLFVGTGAGVYETRDGGASWAPDTLGLPAAFSVRSLALLPGSAATLYAGSDSSGIYRSTDSGLSWAPTGAGIPTRFIHALLIDASAPATVYAATDSGVYRTQTAGDVWSAARTGLPYPAVVRALVQDPDHPAAIFCAVDGYGVFESLDRAGSWVPLTSASGAPGATVYSLAIDGKLATLYAGSATGVWAYGDYPRAVSAAETDPQAPRLALGVGPVPARDGRLQVTFSLPRAGQVSVRVFDVRGELVRTVTDRESMAAGRHVAAWDGRDRSGRPVPDGVYFVRLESGEGYLARRAVLLGR